MDSIELTNQVSDRLYIRERWKKAGDDVFVSKAFNGGPWGEWELTPCREIPFIILHHGADGLLDVERTFGGA